MSVACVVNANAERATLMVQMKISEHIDSICIQPYGCVFGTIDYLIISNFQCHQQYP